MILLITNTRYDLRPDVMQPINIDLQKSPSPEQISLLAKNFNQYVKKEMPGLPAESEDQIFMLNVYDDKQHYIGGILANCYWDGLEIDTLWISPSHRGNGLGTKLLQHAEQYALNNGSVIAFLRTVDAKQFYEKSGYAVYGILEDRPIGTFLYHMKKRLNAPN